MKTTRFCRNFVNLFLAPNSYFKDDLIEQIQNKGKFNLTGSVMAEQLQNNFLRLQGKQYHLNG